MIDRARDLLRGGVNRRTLRHWKAAVESAPSVGLAELKQMRMQARALRYQVDRVEHIATSRLTHPRLGSNVMRKPAQTDWAYRPEVWRGPISPAGVAAASSQTRIGTATSLFHDCTSSEITIRQIRNMRETDLAPFGLRLDAFGFDGSFLSVVVDLPDSAIEGLHLDHIIRLNAVLEAERPVGIYVRLNIKFGPNVEQITRELPMGLDEIFVEFDLQHTEMNVKTLERMWIDLIVDGAWMNEITLRDVTLTRRRRAAF